MQLLALLLLWGTASAFTVLPLNSRRLLASPSSSLVVLSAKTAKKRLAKNKRGRKPSKVRDPDGPTPNYETVDIESVDPESGDVPELMEMMSSKDMPEPPISHQPWRRGATDGCEDPIAAEWRQEAEELIYKSVDMIGAKVLDITWYLTSVVVTLDEEMQPADIVKTSGPVINIIQKGNPEYADPADPNPEEIIQDQDEVVNEYQTEEDMDAAKERLSMTYATRDADDEDADDGDDHIPIEAKEEVPLYANEESRSDVAFKAYEDTVQWEEESEKPVDLDATLRVDSSALSSIAKAILDALEEREDDLRILQRHELILTSPGSSDVLESQRQFDAYRGFDVIVETLDPFDSNRTLKGKLMSRNSMDVIINQKGRMVTIPLNFVKCVRLPPAKREKGVPRDAPF